MKKNINLLKKNQYEVFIERGFMFSVFFFFLLNTLIIMNNISSGRAIELNQKL